MWKSVLRSGVFLFSLFSSGALALEASEKGSVYGGSLAFAEYLAEKGSVYEAITEYERFLFLRADPSDKAQTWARIGTCYFRGGRWKEARRAFEEVMDSDANPRLKFQAQVWIAGSYLKEGRYALAEFELADLLSMDVEGSERGIVQYWRGWNFLEQGRWKDAQETFSEAAERLNREEVRALASAAERGRRLPKKSEKWAKGLSTLVPGLGHIYAGRIGRGLVSIVTNGMLGTFTVDAVLERRYAEGAALYLLVWSRYYAGSRYHSQEYVRHYNRSVQDRYLTEIRRRFPPEKVLEKIGWDSRDNPR